MYPTTEFTPIAALAGGLMIGLASLLLLAVNGRLAGISGIVGHLPRRQGYERHWRLAFVLGLILGAAAYAWQAPGGVDVTLAHAWPWMLAAGFIVGIGTRLGRAVSAR